MEQPDVAARHRRELEQGERFAFGRNWRGSSRPSTRTASEPHRTALLDALGVHDLRGQTFLDIGCGSGLSALAALRSGARVTAFDYDPEAVAATRELLGRWAPSDSEWTVLNGSALDRDFVLGLGHHDVVHSWGVLHHTGAMWDACAIAAEAVPPGGMLFIAIYNDAGAKSEVWTRRKRRYVRLPAGVRTAYAWTLIAAGEALFLARALRDGRPGEWLRRWTHERPVRGMSRYRDWIDWIGGHPYEYASAGDVLARMGVLGLEGRVVVANDGTGCNELVFTRAGA
jgi:2-polyprenyl-3-methyl-5-hydroxy-6-metoxy-1,4-benzoquinol methylase